MSVRLEPKILHWECFVRVLGYLQDTKDFAIHFRTAIPEFPNTKDEPAQWNYSVYEGIKEDIPPNHPSPLGEPVCITVYVDANLMFCKNTGHFVLVPW